MIFWMSSEVMDDVSNAVGNASKLIEEEVNKFIKNVGFNEFSEKWALIAIIVGRDLEKSFPEVVRKSSKGKVLEFRLQIRHDEFLASNEKDQIGMIFDCLSRSIDLMSGLKIKPETQTVLRTVLAQARQSMAA